ncbi:MAG: hypothetical protein JWO53_1359 [Chlamydiia bacterium]|nr:hypothetical protein [Chlamydiia bacterium]
MKHRASFAIFFPLIAALFFLSLPVHINISLRDSAGHCFSSFWRLIHNSKKKNKVAEKRAEIEKFFTNRLLVKQESLALANAFLEAKSFPNTPSKLLVGEVLYRSVHTWNSSLWIDLGDNDNPLEGAPLIAKNSPVLSGDSVVGVIDFVGKRSSLVRLITDSGLTPSVRVQRGVVDNKKIISAITTLSDYASNEKASFSTEDEKKAFFILLDTLTQNLQGKGNTAPEFLAKGEIQGHGEPLWRTPGQFLRGIGFNYDFKDSYGPARDLRTGEPIDPENEYTPREKTPLIQVGDTLVTSGMDGIFPEGLQVAKVHSILPLREGAYSYELRALPTAGDLMDLKSVIVLPPQSFSQADIPSRVEKLLKEIPG